MGLLLRVLIVEDSSFDTDLVLHMLLAGGFVPDWRRVETEEELQEALSTETWELIICDYHLPTLDARTVLATVQRMKLDLPFIVVSGVVSDEDAAAIMNAGAHDYVPKSSLKRLCPIVHRELRESRMRAERVQALKALEQSLAEMERRVAERTEGLVAANRQLRQEILERKRTEVALESTQTELNAVTQTMSAGVARCSSDLQYRWVNPAFAALIGRPPDEIAGRGIEEVLGRAWFQRIRPYIEQVLQGKKVEYEEQIAVEGVGPSWFHVVCTPAFNEDGIPDGWVAVANDMTTRKRVEEALKIAHDELEQKVQQRTADLSKANQQLQSEIAERQSLESALRQTAEQLELERAELIKKNIALQEIFEHVKSEKALLKQQLRDNMEQIIMPALVRLKETLNPSAALQVEMLEREIVNLTSPFLMSLRYNKTNLSPREVDICRLIRNGLSTKEIADALSLSPMTVQKHREVIRRKLGLTNEETNLQTYLQSLSEER